MIVLDKKDIEDIANGYLNTHLQSQNIKELLKTLALKVLEKNEDCEELLFDLNDKFDEIKGMIHNVNKRLDNEYDDFDDDLSEIDDKIEEIDDIIEELKYVL